jgi:DedD protein
MATGQSSRPRTARGSTSDDGALDPALPQKKRARHRLIGAIALCLLAVMLLPLVLESEPVRPVSNAAIHIPARESGASSRPVEPHAAGTILPAPAEPAPDPAAEPPIAGASTVLPSTAVPQLSLGAPAPPSAAPPTAKPSSGAATPGPSAAGAAPKTAAAPSTAKPSDAKAAPARQADAKTTRPEAPQRDAGVDEIKQLADAALQRSATATAAKQPQSTTATAVATPGTKPAPSTGRYLIQVGAYSNDSSARQAVDRVQGAGLAAFTERIKTERGDRIRVRVGPFPDREAAERARDRLKASGMEAALIAP